jgi:hypothetical protein
VTRDEIRAAIVAAWEAPRPGRLSLAGEFADGLGTITEAVTPMWAIDDFRASEEERFDGLLSEATVSVRIAAEAMLLDAVVRAMVAFAAECPAAPRVVKP